jgi:uncharacterized protein (DUF736 family)
MAAAKSNKGYLNTNKYKKNEKHPDFRGKIKVDVDFIKELANAAKSGSAEVHVSGWGGNSKQDGTPYIYVSLEAKPFAPQGSNFKSFSAPVQAAPAVAPVAPAPPQENGFDSADDDPLDGLL